MLTRKTSDIDIFKTILKLSKARLLERASASLAFLLARNTRPPLLQEKGLKHLKQIAQTMLLREQFWSKTENDYILTALSCT